MDNLSLRAKLHCGPSPCRALAPALSIVRLRSLLCWNVGGGGAGSCFLMYMKQLVKTGWILASRYIKVCECVPSRYTPIWTGVCTRVHGKQRGRKKRRMRERTRRRRRRSVSFVFTMNLRSPAKAAAAAATPHPLYPQQMATRQLPADTHTHTHSRMHLDSPPQHARSLRTGKIGVRALSERSSDPGCRNGVSETCD